MSLPALSSTVMHGWHDWEQQELIITINFLCTHNPQVLKKCLYNYILSGKLCQNNYNEYSISSIVFVICSLKDMYVQHYYYQENYQD